MTNQEASHQSLCRRLKAAGDGRYLADRLAGLLPIPGPVRPGTLSFPRVLEKLTVIGSDLVECVRAGRTVPYIGEPRRAILETEGAFPQHPRYVGYWYDPSIHSMAGLHLGVDLIRRNGKHYVLEMNMDAALRPERRALYDSAIDPVFQGIAAAASEGGFRRVVIHRSRWLDGQAAEFEEAGRERGIEAIPSSFPSAWWKPGHPMGGMPRPLPEGTMYVFVASRNTPVDYYVHDKLCVWNWFRDAGRAESDGSPVVEHVPTYDTPDLPDFNDDPRWPNLVAKFTDWDQGKFVRFARVRDGREAREALGVDERGGTPKALRPGIDKRILNRITSRGRVIYQPFIPMPVDEGGRLTYVRLHLLVTPLTSRFLSAHAIVGNEPVPAELPYGLVLDARPFILNFSKGAHYRRVESEIEEEVREVANRIGAIAADALARRFVTSPRSG